MTPQRIKKIQGNLFIAFIICLIVFIYFCNTKLIWIDRRPSNIMLLSGMTVIIELYLGSVLTYSYLILFNVVSFMLVWSLLTSMFTDPGRVPQNWGYFLEDPEQKKRRYCLICHIFKPERTHHCSACNRCVLNMDHHCPWLGNCIGFANRKFFLLLLFYVNLSTWIAGLGMIPEIYNILVSVKDKLAGDDTIHISWFSDFLIFVAFALDITAMVVIGIFFKFHLDLLFVNTTTLENLERKRSGPESNSNSFNMGEYYNFVQVFGNKPFYWPFPFFVDEARQVGDGVIWPKKAQDDSVVTQQQSMTTQKPNHNDNTKMSTAATATSFSNSSSQFGGFKSANQQPVGKNFNGVSGYSMPQQQPQQLQMHGGHSFNQNSFNNNNNNQFGRFHN